MRNKRGNLFTSDALAYGHGVNIRGLMGAGIAKTFKERYPENYIFYGQQCKVNGLPPGSTLIVPAFEKNFVEGLYIETRLIVNMASQDEPGPNARYDWLFDSALSAARQLISIGVDVCAIPEIGCGIGGLRWDAVKHLLITIEELVPGFEWEVWKYEPTF